MDERPFRRRYDFPRVDFPDWQLVRDLVEVIDRDTGGGVVTIACEDRDGSYADETVDAAMAKAEMRDEEPTEISVIGGTGRAHRNRGYVVRMVPDASDCHLESDDVKDVVFVEGEVEKAFKRAERRRRQRRLGRLRGWSP